MDKIIWNSDWVRRIKEEIRLIAPHDIPVLIIWETWTGKELVARSIHSLSKRKDNDFVEVNCWAVSESLALSDFFWHEKWSFTWAVQQRKWFFERANSWTLFLDEVGELLPSIQSALLRVLQWEKISRVWWNWPFAVDERILAATNKDLESAIRTREFREDLFYRLNVFQIKVPPLRERPDDIKALVKHFISEWENEFGKFWISLDTAVMNDLKAYVFPWNIRQLQNIIRISVLKASNNIVIKRQEMQKSFPEVYKKDDSKIVVDQWRSTNAEIKPDNPNNAWENIVSKWGENNDNQRVEATEELMDEFIKKLLSMPNPMASFEALFIRSNLSTNDSEQTTAEKMWITYLTLKTKLESLKDLIESAYLDKYILCLQEFSKSLKEAKREMNKLSWWRIKLCFHR